MKGKYFLDTNIFIYSFDHRTPHKSAVASDLIRQALRTGEGITSGQVLQEFLNAATRKFATPLSLSDCKVYLDKVLTPLCFVFTDIELLSSALDLRAFTGYGWYDSLIVAAALAGQCATLVTEDLQDGRKIGALTILNPFK